MKTFYYCLWMINILSLASSEYDVEWEEELSNRDPNKIYQILQCGIEGPIKDSTKKAANVRIVNGQKTTKLQDYKREQVSKKGPFGRLPNVDICVPIKNAKFNGLVLASPLDSISTESTIDIKSKKDIQSRWQNNLQK